MKMTRYNITFGLNDIFSRNEEVNIDELIQFLENVFTKYKMDFSITKATGGYCYRDGKFVYENSAIVTVISNSNEGLDYFISEVKMLLNQETALLQTKQIEVEYV